MILMLRIAYYCPTSTEVKYSIIVLFIVVVPPTTGIGVPVSHDSILLHTGSVD